MYNHFLFVLMFLHIWRTKIKNRKKILRLRLKQDQNKTTENFCWVMSKPNSMEAPQVVRTDSQFM